MNHVFDEEISSAVSKEECECLAKLAERKVVLELGSWLGRSTVAIASSAKRVHAVDWHRGDPQSGAADTLQEFMANINRHGFREKVVVHVGRNEQVLPLFAKEQFDFIFIDSFHERSAVYHDIKLARPLIRPGGTMAFHDYGVTVAEAEVPFGVKPVVDSFAADEGVKVEVVGTLAYVRLGSGKA